MKERFSFYEHGKRNSLKFNKSFRSKPEDEAEHLSAFNFTAQSTIIYKITGSGLFYQHHDPFDSRNVNSFLMTWLAVQIIDL